MTRVTFARPSLALKTTSYQDRTPELNSPASLTSDSESIPTIFSPLTPSSSDDGRDQFVFDVKDKDGMNDDVFMNHSSSIRPGEYVSRFQLHQGRTYLPRLSEVSYDSDQDSFYSQDSACLVYASKSRTLPGPDASVTPKSTLTFAAIWDPDHGLSAFSNNKLIKHEREGVWSRAVEEEEQDPSDWLREVEGNAYLASFYHSDHPDCEPHLASRFSTTTTSTSNYIQIDFGTDDEKEFEAVASQRRERDPGFDLLPGDIHPAWVPQIFTVGYTKPLSPAPVVENMDGRPAISEPFQLAPIKREELFRHNTYPGHPSSSSSTPSSSPNSGSKSYSSLFSKSRSTFGGSHSSSPTSPSSSLRRGLSLGSSPNRTLHPWSSHGAASASSRHETGTSFADGDSSPSPDHHLSTPTHTLGRVGSVLERLKSPKKAQQMTDGSWVLVDVQKASVSTIKQRIVDVGGSESL